MRLEPEMLRRALERAGAAGLPPDTPGGARLAAVLALFVDRGETNLLLIRRADRGDPWSKHIAFPGGHIEPGDADAFAAACRETAEEVGIPREAITPLGDLGTFRTQLPDLHVRVFVGWWDGVQPAQANPSEVAEVFETPVALLAAHHREQRFGETPALDLGPRLTYPTPNGTIWGVTARIIHRLLEVALNAAR